MKMRDVNTYRLEAALVEPFAYSQAWYERRGALLVEIVGDDGLSGWGEAFGPAVLTAPIIEFYKSLLANADAFATELHWQNLYNRLRDHGQKGLAIEALSAIEERQSCLARCSDHSAPRRLLDGFSHLLHHMILKMMGEALLGLTLLFGLEGRARTPKLAYSDNPTLRRPSMYHARKSGGREIGRRYLTGHAGKGAHAGCGKQWIEAKKEGIEVIPNPFWAPPHPVERVPNGYAQGRSWPDI
jgi:hypothetical protein